MTGNILNSISIGEGIKHGQSNTDHPAVCRVYGNAKRFARTFHFSLLAVAYPFCRAEYDAIYLFGLVPG
ncbi:hypothetical protein SAMN06265219_12310 [Gracilimonas mengyeensis]|uniref:Uncharacterized protein n=1 Tax=Gracilimonas mengyeensis TaxID=1302730 RepID=A0A521FLS7_9BACT|nr:hypothetical protein SAMN06265219_12310 [Gracilimonas mengyeensis]